MQRLRCWKRFGCDQGGLPSKKSGDILNRDDEVWAIRTENLPPNGKRLPVQTQACEWWSRMSRSAPRLLRRSADVRMIGPSSFRAKGQRTFEHALGLTKTVLRCVESSHKIECSTQGRIVGTVDDLRVSQDLLSEGDAVGVFAGIKKLADLTLDAFEFIAGLCEAYSDV
jgi:hypothetical protein